MEGATMSIQEQYGENLKKTQEAWVAAVESWTTSVKNAFGQTSADNPFGQVDPNAFIDQYFDLAAKTLEAQREVAKNMAQATKSINEGLRKQTDSAVPGAQG
jgi:hypothetical protein